MSADRHASARISPLAGKPAPPQLLVDVPKLITRLLQRACPIPRCRRSASPSAPPDIAALVRRQLQRIARPGDHARRSATTAAQQGIDGPLFLGIDTHALSEPALRERARGAGGQRRRRHARATATNTRRRRRSRTPSWRYNRGRDDAGSPTASSSRRRTIRRDDGGFKYNPPNGGPADTDVTGWIEAAANALLEARPARACKRMPLAQALQRRDDASARLPRRLRRRSRQRDRLGRDPRRRLRMGVDPLGGAGVHYWARDRRALPAQPRRSSTTRSIRPSAS